RITRASSGGAAGVRVLPARLGRPSSPAGGSPDVAAPRPHGEASAARRPWRPSFASAAPAIPSPDGTADTAVVGGFADHRGPTDSSTNPQLPAHARLSGTPTR